MFSIFRYSCWEEIIITGHCLEILKKTRMITHKQTVLHREVTETAETKEYDI